MDFITPQNPKSDPISQKGPKPPENTSEHLRVTSKSHDMYQSLDRLKNETQNEPPISQRDRKTPQNLPKVSQNGPILPQTGPGLHILLTELRTYISPPILRLKPENIINIISCKFMLIASL